MAAVTFGTPAAYRHVVGDLVVRFYVVNGASGSTLATNQINVLFADVQQFCQAGTASLITGLTVNATTGLLTFTSSGTMVNEIIMVISTKG